MKITWFIPPNQINRHIPDSISKLLRLGYYNYDQVSASVWLRCLQLIPYLEEKGIRCKINDFSSQSDISIFVRWQDDQAYRRLQEQKERKKVIIFDQCVNYFDVTGSYLGNYGVTSEDRDQFIRMAHLSDIFTCPSDFIRERASQEGIQSRYIPESIDLKHFKYSKNKENFNKRSFKAIWSGQQVKAHELNDVLNLLKERNIPLIVISEKKPKLSDSFEHIPWSYYTFPKTILKGDFCISPRKTNNSYDLGHSHLKVGIFLAHGIPALASPIPSYVEVIEKSKGGKICEYSSEWASTFDEILMNPVSLWEWSQLAKKGMEAYSTENVIQEYIKLFQQLLDSK